MDPSENDRKGLERAQARCDEHDMLSADDSLYDDHTAEPTPDGINVRKKSRVHGSVPRPAGETPSGAAALAAHQSKESLPERARQPPRAWRLPRHSTATVMTLLFIMLTNVVLQYNRRPFDLLGVHFPDGALGRVNRCETLGHIPDVIYLGSSRTRHGISPSVVDATVQQHYGQPLLSCNAGDDASTFEEDYYIFKRLVEDGYAPKLVVETLWEYNVDANGKPLADSYNLPVSEAETVADAGDVLDLQTHFPSGIQGKLAALDLAAQKVIPMYGARVGIVRAICASTQIQIRLSPCVGQVRPASATTPASQFVAPTDQYGWSPLIGQSLADLSPAQLRGYAPCTTHCRRFKLDQHEMVYLGKLVALAQARNVRVALVTAPVSGYYFYNTYPQADWDMLIAYWRSFADAHGAAFFDESHDPAFTNADFWNLHHLDRDGAIKFSTWIGEVLVGQVLFIPSRS